MSLKKWIFKDEKCYEDRVEEAQRIKRMYPDSIPIIVQKHPKSILPELEKKKFIVPKERKFSEFHYLIRKKIKLTDTQALFLIIKDFSPNFTSTILQIYQVCNMI